MKSLQLNDWQAVYYEQKNVLMLIVDAGEMRVIKAKKANKSNQINLHLIDREKNVFASSVSGFPDHYASAILKNNGYVLQMGQGSVVKNNIRIDARA